MKIKSFTIVAGVAAALIATGASAADRVEVSRTVATNDLDLSDPHGRDQLDLRIAAAVRRACGTNKSRDLNEIADIHRCRREARLSGARGRELALARTRRDGVAMLTATNGVRGK
jgi:UrcA family protein